ncbi:MAG: hypothetical protein FAF05_04260 [Epsilonproteobacteria bacterium]|nr:hypothetical protein [Campylobacterota bacterium]
MSDKTELLEEIEHLQAKKDSLTPYYFFYVLFMVVFVTMFTFPKIYLNQQIYYKSRDIAKLKIEYEMLKEENKRIKASVEAIKFKNQILDTIF